MFCLDDFHADGNLEEALNPARFIVEEKPKWNWYSDDPHMTWFFFGIHDEKRYSIIGAHIFNMAMSSMEILQSLSELRKKIGNQYSLHDSYEDLYQQLRMRWRRFHTLREYLMDLDFDVYHGNRSSLFNELKSVDYNLGFTCTGKAGKAKSPSPDLARRSRRANNFSAPALDIFSFMIFHPLYNILITHFD